MRMVNVIYDDTKGRVVIGSGMSDEFPVNIGLRQGTRAKPIAVYLSDGANRQKDHNN